MTPPHAAGTRERIVRATSRLLQRQGYTATGLKEISQASQATLGSVYHFFPGGKRELAVAAIRHGDAEFADQLREALGRDDDPAAAVAACAEELARGLRESDWLDGCPVTTAALESAGHLPDIQRAAAEAFAHWRGLVRDRLTDCGLAPEHAADLAHTVINTLEGAEMAAQVSRSEEPLLIAGRHLARLIDSYR
ncbi:TetR/AcrR family transcriptional regulator [Streptomonospora nanhaiensis]|uniref:AcrR family transcriptional regulator n=1 Tax=Streptomonospora nanhaiensis TaxID=1323731 RepID=A0A853BHX2_9ACTN|nr:TetR/AcrR family transcriptional regulator [Streptomonospora nanhaiensis]MBV2363170.1 TetR/AcrR family transcriptional regulator [Streptomonospora nanhaiensis]MBX9387444.1 TetR/AcrR family transcriptional regulator [Streptomonospora nanhaiensis]NYI94335.1 AcrR family transcriptional regulator [Streptomonospora nanhaiensis]